VGGTDGVNGEGCGTVRRVRLVSGYGLPRPWRDTVRRVRLLSILPRTVAADRNPPRSWGSHPNIGNTSSCRYLRDDAAGQAFGALSKQVGGGTSKHEQSRRQPWSVGENAKHWEEVGVTLDLVQYNQAAELLQS